MAADRTHLRVASPGEKPARKERKTPRTITEAIDGSGRDVLASMRRALAQKLDAGEVSSNAIASAYKELRELDRMIRAMDAAEDDEESAGGNRARRDDTFDASAI